MAKKQINSDKVMAEAVVSSNRQIGDDFYILGLTFRGQAAKTFAQTQPGQFAELDLTTAAIGPTENIPEKLRDASERKLLLRRPFSFSDITCKSDKTSGQILYSVIGPGTLHMSNLKAGDSISVIGPLGIGFSVLKEKRTAILVTGGMGAGPIEHLARFISEQHCGIKITAFAGAKSRGQNLLLGAASAGSWSRLRLRDGLARDVLFASDAGAPCAWRLEPAMELAMLAASPLCVW